MFSKFKNILQENISEFINEKDEFNDNDSKPLDLYSEFKTPIQYLEKDIYKINDIKSKKSEQILQSWKPYSTVAVWYIWRVIDPDVVQY